jgi:GT2 family glycosyltransferase
MPCDMPVERSFVIPILAMSLHRQYNIQTLLADLADISGEVICIFNSPDVYDALHGHPRIDKYCYNKLNAGVSRSWNQGINLAEGRSVFVLNDDLQVTATAIEQMEAYLFSLPHAVIVGPQGTMLDFMRLRVIRYYDKGQTNSPIRTDDVSGFFFAVHLQRYLEHQLCFDVRYSPCFMEEWDMGMQVKKAGLALYTVPVIDYHHDLGISAAQDDPSITYFGRTVCRDAVLKFNREQFLKKWFGEP